MRRAQHPFRCARPPERSPHARAEHRYLCRQAGAGDRRGEYLTEIESVTLEFGEVSGIVPEYLEDCWNWYTKKEPIIQGTKFLYEIIPAVTWCDDCKQTYPTVQYGKTCPHCGSGKTWLQQGNEINIKQIEAR